MSKGPGRVERAITEAFRREPDFAFVTSDLIKEVWPDRNSSNPTKAERVSVVRAAKNVAKRLFAAKEAAWEISQQNQKGGELIFHNALSVQSEAFRWLRASWLNLPMSQIRQLVYEPLKSNHPYIRGEDVAAAMAEGGVFSLEAEKARLRMQGITTDPEMTLNPTTRILRK